MKKINVIIAISLIAILFIVSCQKDNVKVGKSTIKVKSNSTAHKIGGFKSLGFNGSYLLASQVGHTSIECKNSCITIGGIKTHFNCQGFGNKCSLNASINVSKVQPDNPNDPYYYAIGLNNDEPSNDSIYNMPDRSFYIEDVNLENGYIWLNVPAQILFRDIESGDFIYRNITFTKERLFENI